MTEEQEIDRIYAVLKEFTARINAVTDELQPYLANKRMLEDELRKISFATEEKVSVLSMKFCGTSPIACKERLELYGEIIEPGYFDTVERFVGIRNRSGIVDRRTIFAELLGLAEEWGPLHNQLRDLKADRAALGRRLDALNAIIARKRKRKPPPQPPPQERFL